MSPATGTKKNESAYRQFVDEVINNGNVAAVDEMVADDFVDHEYFSDDIPQDREGLKRGIRMCRECLSGLSVDVHEVASQGDKVIARTTWRGRQSREAGGEPASGQRSAMGGAGGEPVQFETLEIGRYKNGKLVEHWGLTDDGPGWPTAYYLPQRAAS